MANCILISGTYYDAPHLTSVQPLNVRTLGPYRLAQSLIDNGYTVEVIDYAPHFTIQELKDLLSHYIDKDTIWVGFSGTFFKKYRSSDKTVKSNLYYSDDVVEITQFLKSKSVKVLYGSSSMEYQNGGLEDPNIDIYVSGYSDDSIVTITKHLKENTIDLIPHLQTIDNRRFINSADYGEPSISTVNTDWSNFRVINGEALPIELARGCIFKCKFCSYSLIGKKKGTYIRDLEVLKQEFLRNYYTHGVTNYTFTDDTFNDDDDKIRSLHHMIMSLPFKITFSAFLRLDLINRFPHQAVLLKEMGLVGAFFGVETLNHKSGVAIGKGLHPNKVKDRLFYLRDVWGNNVNFSVSLILGLPYDDAKYFKELLKWVMATDNPCDSIHFNRLFIQRNKSINASEFGLNPEIYGYTFEEGDNYNWTLASQNLTRKYCIDVANEFLKLRAPLSKISDFYVTSALDIGIPLEDILNLRIPQLYEKYDVQSLNLQKIQKYKNSII